MGNVTGYICKLWRLGPWSSVVSDLVWTVPECLRHCAMIEDIVVHGSLHIDTLTID